MVTDQSSRVDPRILFERIPGQFLVLRPDLTIETASDAYLLATMTERSEIEGRGLFQVFPEDPRDPSATGARKLRESLDRVATTLRPDTLEIQRYDIRRPGTGDDRYEERHWRAVSTPLLDDAGSLAFIIHQVEDVTDLVRLRALDAEMATTSRELKRLSTDMERFFALSSDMFAVFALDGTFVRVNPAWETVLGYRPEDLAGRPYLDLVHPDDRASTLAEFRRASAGGQATTRFENRVLHRDGSFRWLEWTGRVVRGEEVNHAAARDITDRKQVDLALASARLALHTHNRALRDEVAVASRALHDLTDQWAAVTAALARLAALDTPEATATAICAELDALPDLAGSAILAFGAGGSTVPLGVGSFVDGGLVVNVPLRDEWSGILRERAADGAWIQPIAVSDLAPVAVSGPTTIACVPLRDGGSLLGLLIASVHGPDGVSRLARRLPALETFAALASALLSRGIMERQRDDAVWGQIDACVAGQAFTAVFQPIVDLTDGTLVGYEALTRFTDGVPPDRRFADAAAVGLGLSLETATMTAALAGVSALPQGVFMSLNVSPEMLLDGDRVGTMIAATAAPVVLEITEHVPIEDYPQLRDAIARLGPRVRFAVDDAGSGFASFRHILELRPDFLKLDIGLVRDIDRDPARQAFVAAMVYFSARTVCTLIAEGIETPAEQRMLRELGVALGQGYLMGSPAALPARRADARSEGSAQVA